MPEGYLDIIPKYSSGACTDLGPEPVADSWRLQWEMPKYEYNKWEHYSMNESQSQKDFIKTQFRDWVWESDLEFSSYPSDF